MDSTVAKIDTISVKSKTEILLKIKMVDTKNKENKLVVWTLMNWWLGIAVIIPYNLLSKAPNDFFLNLGGGLDNGY